MDTFIDLVREKQCLWNLRHTDYHNKNLIRDSWAEVEKKCGLEGGTGAKKWKNLRDTFRRELRKETQVPSGSAAMHSSKWVHFNDLGFLKDIMEPRAMSGNLTLDSSFNEEVEAYDIDEVQSPNSFESHRVRPPKRGLKRKQTTDSDFLELEKRKLQILEKDADDEDDDYHYLLSFRKYMKKMDDEKKLKFRIKMQEVLYDVMYKDNPQRSLSAVSFVNSMTNSSSSSSADNIVTFPHAEQYEVLQRYNN